MNNPQHRNIWRRVSAVLVGFLGVWVIVCEGISPLINGLRMRNREFMNHLPELVIVALVIIGLGSALLFAAHRLWRRPTP